ncbi:hypothetical protein Clacol_004578 [Clathrus columnatus]|uniref:Uncharacterized protein n=1 Tax=Clathrus columnatus TaxID=1419009 RepID=A0AAV5A6V7_9AGAM|nr:hypothetical protein Clacol_004578 [Clathrus columnatus]
MASTSEKEAEFIAFSCWAAWHHEASKENQKALHFTNLDFPLLTILASPNFTSLGSPNTQHTLKSELMSETQDQQHLVISFESELPAGPPSSSSSSSSTSSSSSRHNATARNMRSATVSSTSGHFTFDRRQQFSPYPSFNPRRSTISGSDLRQHPRSHSPPTPSTLLDDISSPQRSHLSYHTGPPSSISPSPRIPSTILLPNDTSPHITSSRYHFDIPSSSMEGSNYSSLFDPPNGEPRSYPSMVTLPPPYAATWPDISNHHDHTREKALEDEIKELQSHIRSLQTMINSTNGGDQSGAAGTGRDNNNNNQLRISLNGSIPSSFNPALGPPPSDWETRTRTRERIFCALNRAGNALCAWHDSRRERRRYPPRMAPPRTLNCGCTYEQALFEESLSRNGVGSYWPGELVRMDPVLRNSLLTLLEQLYNYRDGDFERNLDGSWKEGQDSAAWEERAQRPLRRER